MNPDYSLGQFEFSRRQPHDQLRARRHPADGALCPPRPHPPLRVQRRLRVSTTVTGLARIISSLSDSMF